MVIERKLSLIHIYSSDHEKTYWKVSFMDETLKLIELAHQGDKAARDRLVTDNMGLIWSIVCLLYTSRCV